MYTRSFLALNLHSLLQILGLRLPGMCVGTFFCHFVILFLCEFCITQLLYYHLPSLSCLVYCLMLCDETIIQLGSHIKITSRSTLIINGSGVTLDSLDLDGSGVAFVPCSFLGPNIFNFNAISILAYSNVRDYDTHIPPHIYSSHPQVPCPYMHVKELQLPYAV